MKKSMLFLFMGLFCLAHSSYAAVLGYDLREIVSEGGDLIGINGLNPLINNNNELLFYGTTPKVGGSSVDSYENIFKVNTVSGVMETVVSTESGEFEAIRRSLFFGGSQRLADDGTVVFRANEDRNESSAVYKTTGSGFVKIFHDDIDAIIGDEYGVRAITHNQQGVPAYLVRDNTPEGHFKFLIGSLEGGETTLADFTVLDVYNAPGDPEGVFSRIEKFILTENKEVVFLSDDFQASDLTQYDAAIVKGTGAETDPSQLKMFVKNKNVDTPNGINYISQPFSVSPNGQNVVFSLFFDDGRSGIYRVKGDGSMELLFDTSLFDIDSRVGNFNINDNGFIVFRNTNTQTLYYWDEADWQRKKIAAIDDALFGDNVDSLSFHDLQGLNNKGEIAFFIDYDGPTADRIFYGKPIFGSGQSPAVPEPATIFLLGSGLLGFALKRKKAA